AGEARREQHHVAMPGDAPRHPDQEPSGKETQATPHDACGAEEGETLERHRGPVIPRVRPKKNPDGLAAAPRAAPPVIAGAAAGAVLGGAGGVGGGGAPLGGPRGGGGGPPWGAPPPTDPGGGYRPWPPSFLREKTGAAPTPRRGKTTAVAALRPRPPVAPA